MNCLTLNQLHSLVVQQWRLSSLYLLLPIPIAAVKKAKTTSSSLMYLMVSSIHLCPSPNEKPSAPRICLTLCLIIKGLQGLH